jgi:hypothetical protein
MKMPRLLTVLLLTCSMLVVLVTGIRAEETSSPAKPTPIDPQALELLKRMSTTLGAAKAFTYQFMSTVEVPARSGQFITLFATADVALKRPDKLRARLSGEAPHFDFYFDGATSGSLRSRKQSLFRGEGSPTIDAMLPALEQETGIRFASVPLLFSDPYDVLTRRLISGLVVGPALVKGVTCQHLAFRSPGVNWEI